jgi:predicted amidohydrolase
MERNIIKNKKELVKNPKIVIVQYSVETNNKQKNMEKVEKLLEDLLKSETCDLIVLPELSFTKYIFFNNKKLVYKLSESLNKTDLDKSLTYQWCKKISKKYNSYVCCGLMTREENNFYNSLLLVNKNQEIVMIYNKTKKFYHYEDWSTSGTSFTNINTPEFGKISFGICMDISENDFTTNNNSTKDFAKYCYIENINLIIFISAVFKLRTKIYPNYQQDYWYKRLTPFLNPKTFFIAANRIGNELNFQYCGSSVILRRGEDNKKKIELSFNEKEEIAKMKEIKLIKNN